MPLLSDTRASTQLRVEQPRQTLSTPGLASALLTTTKHYLLHYPFSLPLLLSPHSYMHYWGFVIASYFHSLLQVYMFFSCTFHFLWVFWYFSALKQVKMRENYTDNLLPLLPPFHYFYLFLLLPLVSLSWHFSVLMHVKMRKKPTLKTCFPFLPLLFCTSINSYLTHR